MIQLSDVPIAACLTLFFIYGGYSVFLSIAQVIFLNKLLPQLQAIDPNLTKSDIIKAGATGLKSLVSENLLDEVLVVYARCLNSAFYIAVGAAATAVLMACGVKWTSLKDKDNAGLKDS